MTEKSNIKYPISEKMRERLKLLAKSKGFSQNFLYQELDFDNLYQYKNLFKKTGTQKFIKEDTLRKLSHLYRVSIDYLIGKTDYGNLNADGTPVIFPLDFSMSDDIRNTVINYIKKPSNYEFTKDINFIISLPDDNRGVLIQTLHSIVSILETNYFYTERQGLSQESVKMITDALKLKDKTTDNRLIQFAKLCQTDPDSDPAKCLTEALRLLIMPCGIPRNEHREALKKILYLAASWSSFPKGLYKYMADFSELCYSYSFQLSAECKNDIEEIIKSLSPKT